jgi:hypothetical protein
MGVRADCRHYLRRSTAAGDVSERCRLEVNQSDPFACPEGCLFFEERALSDAGWAVGSATPLSNTADGLAHLPPKPGNGTPSGKGKKSKKRR